MTRGVREQERWMGERKSKWVMVKATQGRVGGRGVVRNISAKITQTDREGEGATKAGQSDKRGK